MNRESGPNGKSYKQSSYNLADVRRKIFEGLVKINRDAATDAFQIFGWKEKDIIAVYRKLKPVHFYKTDESRFKPGIMIDIYKADINGEHIYTHFYVNQDGLLIINSFHDDAGR